MRLKDRVVIVTGGASGIGKSISIKAANEGARVVVADIRENPLEGGQNTVDAILMAGGISTYMNTCLLYTSPSPRDGLLSRMPSSA